MSSAQNHARWNDALAAGTEPDWLVAIDHDLDDDGTPDFELALRDNHDELAIADDPTRDNDLAVFVTSRCVKYPEVQPRIAELVRSGGGGTCYQSQLGGCGGNNNAN